MSTITAGPPRDATAAMARRVLSLARIELTLYRRSGVLAAAAGMTVAWAGVLIALPQAGAVAITPFVLFTDVTALGFLFIPALLVAERTDGADPALRVSPVRTAERVGVRVIAAAALSVGCGAVVVVAAGSPGPGAALLAVVTSSVLFGLLACVLVGTADSLTTLMIRAPFVAGPMLVPAVAVGIGVSNARGLFLSPASSALQMMSGHMSWAGLTWQLLWIAGVAVIASRRLSRPPATVDRVRRSRHTESMPVHPGPYRTARALRAFARTDRRGMLRDGLLVMLAAGVPLVAVLTRVLAATGAPWVRARYGVDLSVWMPAVWAFVLVVHTPVIFGSLTGLLLLEDRDRGLLPALATTRASLTTMLGYRLTATVVITAVMVAVGLPLAGATHPAGVVGAGATVVAAGALSAVPAMLMAALARNRVQGIAAMKLMALPLYLPIATWTLDGAWRWLFAGIPSSWAVWTSWSATPGAAVALACASVALSALLSAVLTHRFLATASDR